MALSRKKTQLKKEKEAEKQKQDIINKYKAAGLYIPDDQEAGRLTNNRYNRK
jgi:hypothetical protein